ncbi:AlkA N-terminal domain-containing protein, partial [Leucobacter sp. M11]|uniref:AlkA N-terminal domain-containing protein n=1 Tax=Leucobacter sp. M11 TaxID=2993565 RepID=UPI002D7E44F3
GFRACKRCRPDALPGTRDDNVRGELVGRAVRLIRDGAVDDAGVPGLAERLAVSERHLRRVLVEEIGASPQQLNRTRRAHAARTLIEQTTMPLSEVAFAAGFGSVRQFNGVMLAEFGTQPSALPRGRTPQRGPGPDEPASDQPPTITLRLRHRAPYATGPMRAFLSNHAVPGREVAAPGGEHLTRALSAPGGPALATVRWGDDPEHLTAELRLSRLDDLMPVIAGLRRWLDLDADPLAVSEALGTDPVLAPLFAKRPGIRIPGSVDGAELALNTVLGQQVSIPAARTLQGRLVAAFGTEIALGAGAEGAGPTPFRSAPDPARIAASDPERLREILRITSSRARTVHALAEAIAGGLRLDPG